MYKRTGRLPQYILDRSSAEGSVRAESGPLYGSLGGEPSIPICKEFLRGECKRQPGRCKFRHVKQGDHHHSHRPGDWNARDRHSNGYGTASPGPYPGHPSAHHHVPHPSMVPPGHPYPPYGQYPAAPPMHHYHYPGHHPPPPASNGNPAPYPPAHHHPLYPPGNYAAAAATPIYPPRAAPNRPPLYDPYSLPEAKRRAYEGVEGRPSKVLRDEDNNASSSSDSGNQRDPSSDSEYGHLSSQVTSAPKKSNQLRYFEEENLTLRRRVEDLKNQVSDLMTRNEFLLDQNAQLRASVAATGAVVAAAGGFPGSMSKGLHVPSSAASAAASVAAASSAAQHAVASAVAAAAAAGAGAAGLPTNPTVGQSLPTSVTVELPVSSLPVFSAAASGVPCVSSIAASLLNSTTTMSPIVSHVSSQAANSSALATHFVSYPIMSSPCVTANALNPNSHLQLH